MPSCSGCGELFWGCFWLPWVVYISHFCCKLMLSSRFCLSQVVFRFLSAVRFCRSWYSLCLVVLVCF